ncbi:MAG: Fic family protein [Methanocella sp.]
MRSFTPGFLEAQPLTQGLVQTVRLLGEYKGKQKLFATLSPQVLETLRQVAIIQSVESSNRIEGVTARIETIEALVAEKTTPQNRSQQEIAGYWDVLRTIHANHAHMPFTTGVVRQLHRDLYQFSPSEGGQWKAVNNDIEEKRSDGTTFIRFTPVPAHLAGEAMEELHSHFNTLWEDRTIEPLLLIPSYVLDFLCIHPFRNGNGRMARLLTLLLLYKAGYDVGRYISLEQIVERTRESYYESLYASSRRWHDGAHSLLPWWEYFLGVMVLGAYREYERRVGVMTDSPGAKSRLVADVVERLPRRFLYSEVERGCPGVSRPTIHRVLGSLRQQGRIRCVKAGRGATYEKLDHPAGNDIISGGA